MTDFHTYKIEHYAKQGDNVYTAGYESTPTLINNVLSINVNTAAGKTADAFSLKISDYDNELLSNISIDDKIVIYGSLEGTSSYVKLIDGIINSFKSSQSVDSALITISGLNLLEKLFNSLVATNKGNVKHTASYWVRHIIQQVNEFNKEGNPDRIITIDESEFVETSELINYTKGYEKAFNLIEELSQPKYTGGTNYIYGLNKENEFYYKPRSDTKVGTLTYGVDMLDHTTNKGMFDIVNYIIMNAGKNLFGGNILQMDYNNDSISRFGWKVKLINEAIAGELITQETRQRKNLNVYEEESVFPTSYDYTTSWGEVVSSDSEYNRAFVDMVLDLAMGSIGIKLNKIGSASFKIKCKMLPDLNYELYNVYRLIIPINGTSERGNWNVGMDLRIDKITLNYSNQGWTTDLVLEQDLEDSEGGSI